MTNQEKVVLNRMIEMMEKLQGFEKTVLKDLSSLNKSLRRDLKTSLKKEVNKSYLSKQRTLAVLNETEITLNSISAMLAEKTAQSVVNAGEYSFSTMNKIVSWDGKVKGFNNVALSKEELYTLATKNKLSDKTLKQWVSSAITPDIESLKTEIKKGYIKGEGYKKTVNRLIDDLGLIKGSKHARDLETVAITYIQSINATAQQSVFKANSAVVKQVQWSAIMENGNTKTGKGTCPRCMALDGMRWDLEETDRPPMPLHARCVHPEASVFAPDKIAAFITTYDGPVVELTLSDSRRITASVNHMFATKDGFIKASALTEGSYIVDSAINTFSFLGNPDDNRYPSTIKEQIKTFSKQPGIVSVRVPVTAEDLHGDAEFSNGYIDVVTFDSLLQGDVKAFFSEFFGKDGFIHRNIPTSSFDAYSSFLFKLWRLSYTSGFKVGGFGIDEMFFRRSILHHVLVGLGNPSPTDAVVNEDFLNNEPGSIEAFCNSIFGNHIEVGNDNVPWIDRVFDLGTTKPQSFSDGFMINTKDAGNFKDACSGSSHLIAIKNIRTFDYSGQLYDLHCFSGAYHVNGILTSNCRCMLLPITKTWKDMGFDMQEMNSNYRKWYERDEKGNIFNRGETDKTYGEWWKEKGKEGEKGKIFQNNAVGPTRANLLRDGFIEFGDLVDYENGDLVLLKDLYQVIGCNPYEVVKGGKNERR